MNRDKRNRYTQIMTLNGIHTLSGFLPLQINPEKVIEHESKIKKCNYQVARNRTYLWLKKANRFKEKHRIEYFSKADLNVEVRCLQEKMNDFFRN